MVDNFNRELKDVNERHNDKSNVSNFSSESIIKSKQWFFISVLLIFNEVKFVNLSIRRTFVGMIFTDDVVIDEEFVELNKKNSISICSSLKLC